jgi:hypothetical protein
MADRLSTEIASWREQFMIIILTVDLSVHLPEIITRQGLGALVTYKMVLVEDAPQCYSSFLLILNRKFACPTLRGEQLMKVLFTIEASIPLHRVQGTDRHGTFLACKA